MNTATILGGWERPELIRARYLVSESPEFCEHLDQILTYLNMADNQKEKDSLMIELLDELKKVEMLIIDSRK